MTIYASDCSALDPQPDAELVEWFKELARAVLVGDHVLELGRRRDPDEPLVYCDWDGTWRTGRYIGSIVFKGRTLIISPRLGLDTLRKWLTRINNLVFIESAGELREDQSFIAELLGRVWAHGLAEAARHGLPALRFDESHAGYTVRGRVDLPVSISSRALVHGKIVSVRRERTLDNPIARTIACAYSVLRRWIGPGSERLWLPARCQEILPQILAVTGSSPELPSETALARIRYTPITERYRRFVRLSWQIARQRGLFANTTPDARSAGVLLDVAELWELYVISVLREAAVPDVVTHGTQDPASRDFLLHSTVDGTLLAELRPDAVVTRKGQALAILDAKYKFLCYGPAREDLYQLGSYLMRFGSAGWGALIYPQEPASAEMTVSERKSPWRFDRTHSVSFVTIPHEAADAAAKLRELISPLKSSSARAVWRPEVYPVTE